MRKIVCLVLMLLCASSLWGQPEGKKKIKEEKIITTEYTEDRINEAIFNLEKQLVDLQAEIAVWKTREERIKNEG